MYQCGVNEGGERWWIAALVITRVRFRVLCTRLKNCICVGIDPSVCVVGAVLLALSFCVCNVCIRSPTYLSLLSLTSFLLVLLHVHPLQVQTKKRQTLAKRFKCPFCTVDDVVECKMDQKKGIGSLACRLCGASFQMPVHHLHEPIDVFSEWLDECEAVKSGGGGVGGGGGGGVSGGGGRGIGVAGGSRGAGGGGGGMAAYDDDSDDDELPESSGITLAAPSASAAAAGSGSAAAASSAAAAKTSYATLGLDDSDSD